MLVHDLIKIKLIRAGYLPNYPYHLISDEEMCNAFIYANAADTSQLVYDSSLDIWKNLKLTDLSGSFFDDYPSLNTALKSEYDTLTYSILYHIQSAIYTQSQLDEYTLPDWVYSYMLGKVISVNSDIADIHDLIKPLGVDNIDDIFTADASSKCYETSRNWVNKLISSVNTFNVMLGEHGSSTFEILGDYNQDEDTTIFQLHLNAPKYSYIVPGSLLISHNNDTFKDDGAGNFVSINDAKYASKINYTSEVVTEIAFSGNVSDTDVLVVHYQYAPSQTEDVANRPPTLFGEPHVIKSIRIQQSDPIS